VRTRRIGWLAWMLWVLTLLGLATVVWLDHLLRLAGRPELAWSQEGPAPSVVAAVSAATVGAVLASRRPSHPVGWLLFGLGLSMQVHGVPQEYVADGLGGRPGSLPAAGYLIGFSHGTVVLWLSCASFVLLLTPTGKLPSPRWRWWARLTAVAAVVFLLGSVVDSQPLSSQYPTIGNPLAVRAVAGLVEVVLPVVLVVVCLAVLVAAGSLVVRFRRARGTERQQLRWVALAAGLAPLAMLGTAAGLVVGSWVVVGWALGLYLALPALATGAAILRYRLYDIDRIISRTLAYGLLTVLLGGAYAGVVLGLGQFLGENRVWWWPGRPWRWRQCSSRPAAVSSNWWIGASTGASTTRPRPSRRSVLACAMRLTWIRCRPRCWRWSIRRCSQPRRRCGFGNRSRRDDLAA
jgi:hypothetical protein